MSANHKVGLDDFIVAHGADKLAELLTTAKPADEDADPRPAVYTTVEVHEMARRVRQVLAGVPGIYSRGNVLMEMREKLEPIPKDAMRELLSENIRFFTRKVCSDGAVEDKQVSPPHDAANPVFARPGEPIREVRAVADHPLMLADGRILDASGYDAASGTLVRLPDGFHIDPIPEHPTRDDAKAAAARLLDVFCDFPFADEGDGDPRPGKQKGCHSAAAVVAFMLSVVARQAIAGPVPMFLATKNCPGTGGTLLVETCAVIVAGKPFDVASYPHEPGRCGSC